MHKNIYPDLCEEQQPEDLWVLLPKKARDDLFQRHEDLFLEGSDDGALTLGINPVHISTSYLSKIYFYITFPPTSRS
jgi:hypothetical protein